jgi:hypothetical protein
MYSFESEQIIRQLEPRQGAYFYLEIPSEVVERFEKKRHTRLICSLNEQVEFPCGLNHLGNGNYFIIISKKNLEKSGLGLGEPTSFSIYPDPNPLGVEIPEVLNVLMDQDSRIKEGFEALTDGKKRSLIHSIRKIKNIDLQVEKTYDFFKIAK